MTTDQFARLMLKYCHDAMEEGRAEVRRRRDIKVQRERTLCLQRRLKFCFLIVAVVAAGFGLRYAAELGGTAAQMTEWHSPDPSLQAPQKSRAKQLRKLAETRKQRDEDLNEIMQ